VISKFASPTKSNERIEKSTD